MSFEIVFKARKSDLPILRYVNLNIRNYAQTLVKCLPLFAYTEKRVLPRSGPFSQVLSHIMRCKTWTLGNPNQGRRILSKWHEMHG